MYRVLMILSFSAFSLNSMQNDLLWPDSTFSMEELQEYDPGDGLKLACAVTAERCNLKLDDCQCRFRHHYEPHRGGWFMDVYLEEKITHATLCVLELNRQTLEIKKLQEFNNLREK